ncbi:hypothetical protein ACQEVX_07970 [Streptomyces syringium]|uniref:hypothetical protein n=1 Tax=Streptomyces syringium TaxID=76729 RepID=UPI003D8BCBB5
MKKNTLRLLFAAFVALVLPVTMATSAHADGWVTWRNVAKGTCINAYGDGRAALGPCGKTEWYEFNLRNNVYNLRTSANPLGANCLDGNARGSIYWGKCEGSGNLYQQWAESKVNGKWTLISMGTGLCIQAGNSGALYGGSCAAGNKYIYWE